jgi:hypothetical protein
MERIFCCEKGIFCRQFQEVLVQPSSMIEKVYRREFFNKNELAFSIEISSVNVVYFMMKINQAKILHPFFLKILRIFSAKNLLLH